jgi:RimJ/RimL family protein N-acetyltransferase
MRATFGPLATVRLTLRRYREGDLDRVHSLMSNPRVMRHYPRLSSRDQSRKALSNVLASYETRGYSLLAVERKSDERFIGHVGLLHWDDVDAREDVEVAYMLLPEYWGNGFATEAARASRDWAFASLDVDRVVSFIAVTNQPSIEVAQRNGMARIKRLDDNRFGFPIYVYGVTRDAWNSFARSAREEPERVGDVREQASPPRLG